MNVSSISLFSARFSAALSRAGGLAGGDEDGPVPSADPLVLLDPFVAGAGSEVATPLAAAVDADPAAATGT